MIYCPSCGTANRDGSRFCNECGTKLPTVTSSLCPTCGTLNPAHSLFCEKCGTRLIASLAEEPEGAEAPTSSVLVPKGLSLPTKSPAEVQPDFEAQGPAEAAQSAPEELPGWMSAVQPSVAGTSEPDIAKVSAAGSASEQPEAEEAPDSLGDLGPADHSAETGKTPPDEQLPEWVRRLRTAPEAAQPSASEEEIPDWLKNLGTSGQLPSKEEAPAAPASAAAEEPLPWAAHLGASAEPPAAGEEELPEWLREPPWPYFTTAPGEIPPPPPAPQAQADADEVPDWLRDLRPAAGAEEALPDWLDELGAEEQPASESMALSTGDTALDWLSQLGATAPEPPSDQGAAPVTETPAWLSGASEEPQLGEPATAPDWMSSLRAAAPEVDTQPAEEMPEWLREVQAEQPPPETAATGEASDWMSSLRAAAVEPQAAAEEEGVPDWLKGAGLAAAGAAAVSAHEAEQPQELTVPQKPAADWLAALRQATPEIEAEQAQSEELPEWLREESGAAPEAIGGLQAYDQEVPDWLRETGVVAQQPSISADEEIPEWLRETQPPIESAEAQPPAQPEEEGVPDWLKALGAAAGATAVGAFAEEQKPDEVAPQKPAADWLSALRQATPEIEAEQASEEAEPEWLREESGAAPQAIGGPQAYDQEVPDWLRESGAAVAPAAARGEEEGLPDWLRETEPESAIASETLPAEEVASGETPDWLRELVPPATAAGAAMAAAQPTAEELEGPGEPEKAAEIEPEAETWVSKAAPIAAAGLAAAAVAGAAQQPEEAKAAPAEMPEWLNEIRQEQQAAETAIPVPPPEAAGLTQAEIPAWVEALRPTEEAAAPKETETPSETTGPLAGIAGALPAAPMMDEMHGSPATLQFAVSAEDQARAGVLRELLTRHAVAPASVEQFVVKSSVVRRRALRWIVAFLIIAALFVPIGIDINRSTGLPLLPNAQKMVVPPAVSNAAYEISQVAQLPPNSKVLVVFDYDAAQSGELNRVAAALLVSPGLRNAQIEVASLNPQGSAVAYSVLKNLPGLQYTDLGFVPGQANGVQSLLARAGDVKLIIEVAASPETARWWVEQLQANRSEIPLVVGVSAGAEPLTMPYVQSGQVNGLVSGFPGAVAYLNATGVMNALDPKDRLDNYQVPLDALTLANYVMVALIVVGLIAAWLRGAGRRSA